MLEFSKIDKELSIFRKNKVYLLGAGSAGKKGKRFLEKMNSLEKVIDFTIKYKRCNNHICI